VPFTAKGLEYGRGTPGSWPSLAMHPFFLIAFRMNQTWFSRMPSGKRMRSIITNESLAFPRMVSNRLT
jgi:hypothetical protein